MKKNLLIVIILIGISSPTFAQTTSDVDKIINICIAEKSLLVDLQQNSSTNQVFKLESNLVELSTYQTTLPKSLNINTAFKTQEEVTTEQVESYYEWIFDFSSDKSVIVMVINHEKSAADDHWTFRMKKIADNWVVQ